MGRDWNRSPRSFRRELGFERTNTFEVGRLDRASIRAEVKRFGGFCFSEREKLWLTQRSREALLESLSTWFETNPKRTSADRSD